MNNPTVFPVGSKLRSYDFESRKDCFIEGVLLKYDMQEGCDRYCIVVSRVVFEGKELPNDPQITEQVFPPVNGTPKSFGGVCNFVELAG
jgi:hypothetical protein